MKVIGLAGWSGAGKTTLLSRLVPYLIEGGDRISVVKHAHHGFDIDKPGKDSWVHRQAGATEVLISSNQRWALMHELRGDDEPDLADLLAHMTPVDYIIIEGYRANPHPKIEVHRAANGKPLIFPSDPHVVAVAADAPVDTALPCVALDDVVAIASLVRTFATPLGLLHVKNAVR